MSTYRAVTAAGAAVGAIALSLGLITHTATTDASWTDTHSATSNFEYVASSPPGTPTDPDAIEDYLNGIDKVTPEIVEDLLEGADEEQARTIIETVGQHQKPQLIDDINDLDGLRPSTPEGIEANPDGLDHTSFFGTDRGFCFSFEVNNFTSEEVMWDVTFDTSAAPFWGWEPFTNGEPNFSGDTQNNQGYWASEHWDPDTQEWTVRGTVDPTGNQWWRAPNSAPVVAGSEHDPGSLQVDMCMSDVPVPTINHGLFTYEVSEGQGNEWYQPLRVAARTDVDTYIPWEFYLDLTAFVCPVSLDHPQVEVFIGAHSSDADNWIVEPVAGSSWSADTPYLFRVARAPEAQDVVIRSRFEWDGQPTVYPRWDQTFLRVVGHNNTALVRPDANGQC